MATHSNFAQAIAPRRSPAGYFQASGPVPLDRYQDGPIASPLPSAANDRPIAGLVRRLARFGRLNGDDVDALSAIASPIIEIPADHILIHEARPGEHVFVVIDGIVCRFKISAQGRRQILGYLVAGDLCDTDLIDGGKLDYSVAALSPATILMIPVASLVALRDRYPGIDRALALSALVDRAILREWLLNLGQRNAVERISHFFCEMAARLYAIGQMRPDGGFDIPVSQVALADTTGLTPVHVNRTLKRLRSDGLISFHQHRLTILDRNRLAAIAGFDEDYLHVARCRE